MASVTLTLTSYAAGVGNFTIYHTAIDANNIVDQNVGLQTLIDGYCTDQVFGTYIVQSNTEECTNSYYINLGPTPTPAPTSTPGATAVATPTPTPTATSIFPTPTVTPGGPTPTPFPTQSPTPTPTATNIPGQPTPTPTSTSTPVPTAEPGNYQLLLSSGSVNEYRCGQVVHTPVYSADDPTTWTEYSTRIYTDANEVGNPAYQYFGNNLFYRFKNSTGYDAVWSVSSTGLVSVKGNDGEDCGTTSTLYATLPVVGGVAPCTLETDVPVYTQDFTTVVDMQNGDRIFLDSGLTVQLYSGQLYAISDGYNGTANKRSFRYEVLFGVGNISLCSTPTPVPTSTPTPTPFVSYEYKLTGGGLAQCFKTTGAYNVYSDRNSLNDILSRGGTFYTDSNLTTPFDGNDVQYGISTAATSVALIAAFVGNNTGTISGQQTCGPTPTPVTAYEYFLNEGVSNNTACSAGNVGAYTIYADRSSADDFYNYQVFYTDINLTTPFDGNDLWYGISATSGSAPTNTAYVRDTTGIITSPQACFISPTPTPTTVVYKLYNNPGTTSPDTRCSGLTTTDLWSKVASSSAQIQIGDKLYLNSAATIEIAEGFYYGVSDNLGDTPDLRIFYSGSVSSQNIGVVSEIFNCSGSAYGEVSMSSYALNYPNACADLTPEFQAYYASTVDPYNLQPGDQLFDSPNLNIPFGLNNLYYGVYDGSQLTPIVAYQLYTGSAKQSFTCPTPTPGPTSTPTPTPFQSSEYWISADQFQGGCGLIVGSGSSIWASEASTADFRDSQTAFYKDSALTIPYLDSSDDHGFGSVSGSLAEVQARFSANSNTIFNIAICSPQPTASPTPSATPIPFSWAYYLGSQSSGCGDITGNYRVYTDHPTLAGFLTGSTVFYSDVNLTQVYDGNNKDYALSPQNGAGATDEVFINGSGLLISMSVCPIVPTPTATPTPSPTPIPPTPTAFIYQIFGTSRGVQPTHVCAYTTPNFYYTLDFADYQNASIGDRIYNTNNLATELTTGYYGLSNAGGSNPSAIWIYYTQGSGITQTNVCGNYTTPTPTVSPTPTQTPTATPIQPTPTPTTSPTPTPSPTTSPTPTASPTPSPTPVYFTAYLSNSGFPFDEDGPCLTITPDPIYTAEALSNGSILYTSPSLTTTFDGNNEYWGLSGVENAAVIYSIRISAVGEITEVWLC